MRLLASVLFIFAVILVIAAIVFLILAIVKRKKKLLIGFAGSLAGAVVLFVIITAIQIITFVGLSFFRSLGLPPSLLRGGKVEWYDYNYQHINYYTDEEEDGRRIQKDDLFELWYSVHDNPNSALITEPSGEMLVRRGPPFTFQVFFVKVNSKVESMRFINCVMVNAVENNLLESDNFYIRNSMGHYQDYQSLEEEAKDYASFSKDKVFYRNTKMNKEAERQLIEEVVYLEMTEDNEMREETKDKEGYAGYRLTKNEIAQIMEESRRDSIIGFSKIPIDFVNDEEIIIKGEIAVQMVDGETKIIDFKEKFTRKIEEGQMRNWFPPSSYDHQKE